jgi:hypothetical protein
MLFDIVTFFCCALEEHPNLSNDGRVASYLIYHLEVSPDFIRFVVLPCIDVTLQAGCKVV